MTPTELREVRRFQNKNIIPYLKLHSTKKFVNTRILDFFMEQEQLGKSVFVGTKSDLTKKASGLQCASVADDPITKNLFQSVRVLIKHGVLLTTNTIGLKRSFASEEFSVNWLSPKIPDETYRKLPRTICDKIMSTIERVYAIQEEHPDQNIHVDMYGAIVTPGVGPVELPPAEPLVQKTEEKEIEEKEIEEKEIEEKEIEEKEIEEKEIAHRLTPASSTRPACNNPGLTITQDDKTGEIRINLQITLNINTNNAKGINN